MTAAGDPADAPRRFRRPAAALRELHYRLRAGGDSPARRGVAVALGTFIGCLPLYGLHLLLCTLAARLFRVNLLLAYLAAHINNPLTAPLVLAASFGLGHRLTRGDWPLPDAARLAGLGPLELSRDLLSGAMVLGLLLGIVLGGAAWGVSSGRRRSDRSAGLLEATGRRYEAAGVLHWEFVRGKLRHDPMYEALALRPELLDAGTILDLGCGRGIALALADVARSSGTARGSPAGEDLIGVEARSRLAAVARAALGTRARIENRDLAGYRLPDADLVLLLDVLHYLDGGTQERLLAEVAGALRPGGVALLREADAGGGARFRLTRASERVCALARGDWRRRFRYRSAAEWDRLLAAHGLDTRVVPMGDGTPFANVMIEARRRP